VLPSLVVLIEFALVGTVWWVLQNFERAAPVPQSVSTTLPEAQQSTPAPADSAAQAGQQGKAAQNGASSNVPAVRNGVAASDRARTPAGGNPRAGQVAKPSAATPATSNAPASQGTSAQPPAEPVRAKSIDVTLKFANDSWVEVYDANGQRLFYDIGSANSSRTVSGTPPLRVVLGNAPGVSLNIKGKSVKVPASVVQQDSAQFTINRAGRIVRSRPNGG
jgi:cytoskeleton protein RodZ